MGFFDSAINNAAVNSGFVAPKFNNTVKKDKEDSPSFAKNILGGALSKFDASAAVSDSQRVNGFNFGSGNSFIG